MLKAAMLEGTVEMVALIVGTVVPVPMVLIDVRRAVDAVVVVALRVGLSMGIALGRRIRHVPLICPRVIRGTFFVTFLGLFATLGFVATLRE